jgi:hypothetical protein
LQIFQNYVDIAALITMRIAKHDNQNRVNGGGIIDAGWLQRAIATRSGRDLQSG